MQRAAVRESFVTRGIAAGNDMALEEEWRCFSWSRIGGGRSPQPHRARKMDAAKITSAAGGRAASCECTSSRIERISTALGDGAPRAPAHQPSALTSLYRACKMTFLLYCQYAVQPEASASASSHVDAGTVAVRSKSQIRKFEMSRFVASTIVVIVFSIGMYASDPFPISESDMPAPYTPRFEATPPLLPPAVQPRVDPMNKHQFEQSGVRGVRYNLLGRLFAATAADAELEGAIDDQERNGIRSDKIASSATVGTTRNGLIATAKQRSPLGSES